MISGVFALFGSGVSGQGDFEDGEESFLPYGEEALFSGLIDINNFPLGDIDDLVESFYLPPDHFSDPECSVHESLCGLDGDEGLALSEEESECARDIST